DVAEAGRDHCPEPVMLDGPHGVLAGGAGAEVGHGDQDRRPRVLLLAEHEVAVVAPLREDALLEAGVLDLLEPVRRDDLVRVDVGAIERDGGAGDDANSFHQRSSGVAKWPAIAVAAATAGETRWVRPPRP